MYHLTIIALIMLFIVLYVTIRTKYNYNSNIENYLPYITDPYTHTYTDFPFWNTQIGSTRNMSYDLRGDVPIPYHMWTPFNMSSRIPIQNKPLYMVS